MSNTLIWTIILVVSVIIEAITIDLVSIWFSVGAIVALICQLFHFTMAQQIIAFSITTLICVIMCRPFAKKYLQTNTIKTNLDRYIGTQCLVTKTITANNKGEVKILGEPWLATSLDNEQISEGTYAQIVSFEGSHVVVKKI